MGGGPEVTKQQTLLDPELLKMYRGFLTDYQSQIAGGAGGAGGYRAAAEQAAKGIQTAFTPQFSATPDVMTRGLAAQAGQQMAQQAAAQRAAIANQFRGQPGANMALQRQIDMQSRLQANPILFQAFQQQQQREQLQNQANMQAQQAANQALIQQLGLRAAPLEAQKALLGSVGQALQLTGTQQQIKY